MSWAVLVALAAVLGAVVERLRRRHGALDLDACVLGPTLAGLLIGIAATLLAVFRQLTPLHLSVVCVVIAAGAWPWRMPVAIASGCIPISRRVAWAVGLTVVVGAALRLPSHDYALAGRDQGTYTLRAQNIATRGALDLHDPLIAEAHKLRKRRAGPGDILGLVPTGGERWRADRYEGAYRPGLYLADRARGHVVPQLFHVLPVAMACATLAAGAHGPALLLWLQSVLVLLMFVAIGRRLWPRGGWIVLPVALLATSPLLIWVHRSALTEAPATLLLWGAALAALRARDGHRDALPIAALLLGGSAWIRGHGLMVAPVVALALLAVPARCRSAVGIWAAMVMGSILVHVATTYPYIHDEIARLAPSLHPSPGQLVALALAAALAWDGAHRLALHSRRGRHGTGLSTRWLQHAPMILAVAIAGAAVTWLVLRGGAAAKPFARLDPALPLVGPLLLLTTAAGLVGLARKRPHPSASHAWLAAIGVAVTVPIVMYARRNLPQGGLFYYGRYLAPEIWPACALLSTEALRRLWRLRARSRRLRRTAQAAAWVVAVALVGTTSMPLLTDPATRIREFAGARQVVDALAAQIPRGAVVIAGGEGWHHGHTFNQVGGALLLSHGIEVLPYRSREAAYATLYELLVTNPDPHRPVFLLLNEATKPYRLRDAHGKPTGTKLAAVDLRLDAPFVVSQVDAAEMFVHRLTPVTDRVPTRVTRDELRMVLVAVSVDHDALAATQRFDPPGGPDPRCLHRKKRKTITLPDAPTAYGGPVALVIVASPGTSRSNAKWSIKADGQRLRTKTVGQPRRPHDTIGPFILEQRPRTLSLRGAKRKHGSAPCPYGGVDEIRIVPLDPTANADALASGRARSFAPPTELGHPIEPITWVAGRGLSKARPGIISRDGSLKAAGPSLVLRGGQTLEFPAEPLPDGGRHPLHVVVTLARAMAGPGAQLQLLWNGEVLATIEPPADRKRSWQSEPIVVRAAGPLATIAIRLVTATDDDGDDDGDDDAHVVHLRDIGLFSQGPRLASERVDPATLPSHDAPR